MPNKKEKQAEETIESAAVKAGLNNLIYSNSGLKNYSVFIMNNLDYKKINNLTNELQKKYEKEEIPDEEKNKLIYDNLENYVASGRALKDTAIQTLLDASQEGKLNKGVLEKIVEFFKPNKFGGAKYFEKVRNAYGDMYDILSQDEIAQQKIPELAKAAETLRMYGFLDTTLKNLKAHGVMDEKEFRRLQGMNYENAVIRAEKGKKGVGRYIEKEKEELEKEEQEESDLEKKIAAFIIGLVGFAFVLLNLNITGAVIGENSTITMGIVGIFLIFFALMLFLRPLKKSFKK